jgi:ribulose bisphosphate carboxylase small subunit
VQILQTASFNNLLPYWGQQVEVNIIQQINQKQLSANAANEQLQAFFNQQNIIGFEKTAERRLGNTIYVTGKLISSKNKYSLTLLLEITKKGIEILSVRIS